jgi:magnesium transporter
VSNLFDTYKDLVFSLELKEYKKIRSFFDETNIVDAAALVDPLPTEALLHLFKIIRKELGAELLTYLDPTTVERLTSHLQPETLHKLLEELYSDDLNEILSELPDELVMKVLNSASPELRSEINQFLSYEPNSCGSIMSTDIITLRHNYTVEQAMRAIQRQGRVAETINWCYVIDDKRRLIGVIELKDVLFAADDLSIRDLMDTDVQYVYTQDDQEEAAKLISRYDITAIPVIDRSHAIVGIITVDDILDVVEEEATEDIHKMAAITPLEDSYLKTDIKTIVKSRLPWLLILMISATLTGSVISSNRDLLVILPSLAIFIPMLMDTAGNAGSQAAAMVIRGIIIDDMGLKDALSIIYKELSVSILMGLILFVINTLRIGLFMPDVGWWIAFMVSFTVLIVITLANLVGGLLPLIAVWLKLDPAAMAAPLITTLVDALALIAYFAIATQFLRLI